MSALESWGSCWWPGVPRASADVPSHFTWVGTIKRYTSSPVPVSLSFRSNLTKESLPFLYILKFTVSIMCVAVLVVCPITCISRPSTTTKCWPVGLAAYSEWIYVHLVACEVITLVWLLWFSCAAPAVAVPAPSHQKACSGWVNQSASPQGSGHVVDPVISFW